MHQRRAACQRIGCFGFDAQNELAGTPSPTVVSLCATLLNHIYHVHQMPLEMIVRASSLRLVCRRNSTSPLLAFSGHKKHKKIAVALSCLTVASSATPSAPATHRLERHSCHIEGDYLHFMTGRLCSTHANCWENGATFDASAERHTLIDPVLDEPHPAVVHV